MTAQQHYDLGYRRGYSMGTAWGFFLGAALAVALGVIIVTTNPARQEAQGCAKTAPAGCLEPGARP